jgi:hypothetical protein
MHSDPAQKEAQKKRDKPKFRRLLCCIHIYVLNYKLL